MHHTKEDLQGFVAAFASGETDTIPVSRPDEVQFCFRLLRASHGGFATPTMSRSQSFYALDGMGGEGQYGDTLFSTLQMGQPGQGSADWDDAAQELAELQDYEASLTERRKELLALVASAKREIRQTIVLQAMKRRPEPEAASRLQQAQNKLESVVQELTEVVARIHELHGDLDPFVDWVKEGAADPVLASNRQMAMELARKTETARKEAQKQREKFKQRVLLGVFRGISNPAESPAAAREKRLFDEKCASLRESAAELEKLKKRVSGTAP